MNRSELHGETEIGDMNLGIISIWMIFEAGRVAKITQNSCAEEEK